MREAQSCVTRYCNALLIYLLLLTTSMHHPFYILDICHIVTPQQVLLLHLCVVFVVGAGFSLLYEASEPYYVAVRV